MTMTMTVMWTIKQNDFLQSFHPLLSVVVGIRYLNFANKRVERAKPEQNLNIPHAKSDRICVYGCHSDKIFMEFHN